MLSLRLFIAFETPPAVKEAAFELITRLRGAGADVSWERDEKLHCTLKFLGSTPEDRIPDITRSLWAVALVTPVFRVRYRGLGCFPSRRDPRIVWAGIENDGGELARLHAGIEAAMETLGYAKEERAFRPHLTLGRVRSPRNSRKLIEILETLTLSTDTFPVADIRLMSSETRPSGSVYTVREAFALVGNRPHGE